MCGRFTPQLSWAELHRLAGLIGQPRDLAPRYNIAPTTPIEVLCPAPEGGTHLVPMRWGLIPFWWKKPLKELPATFNARAERVADGPMWRGAFKYRLCITRHVQIFQISLNSLPRFSSFRDDCTEIRNAWNCPRRHKSGG